MLGAVHRCRALVGGVFLFILSSVITSAHASFPASSGYDCRVQAGNGGWSAYRETCAIAALDIRHFYGPTAPISCTNVYPDRNVNTCRINGFTVGDVQYQARAYSCPANATIAGSGPTATCSCNSGYDQVGSGAGATCTPHVNLCTSGAGAAKLVNMTLGWARSATANAKDYVGTIADIPENACSGGCRFGTLEATSVYRSTHPSTQGLYRISADVLMIQTDTECTTTDDVVNPSQVPASCPGYVGEVNGVTTCVGLQSSPIPPATGTPPTKPQEAGNPAAGQAPTSGEGSGVGGYPRTPTAGNGQASGGPASAGIPRGQVGNGTVNSPDEGTEQAACGAPGQSPCRIDESGTNTTVGDGLGPLNDADTSRTGILTGIQSTADKDGTWSVMPRWFTRTSCTATNLGTWPIINVDIEFNLCPWLGLYDVFASLAMVVLTFMACTGMVRDTITGA